ncbi:histone acetyltransferase subunit NuA4-domain-containing protein [Cristinia sonorae]|uniref:Chromatin modification-related protein EAF6 n=1 Tax=Cristinia sonorae TaxID=1940300 RepID=A0A8K0UUS9_9AGAR|nr:histone acetyltransferase subunit NuA4-domain-containing protein [Cristinia sonorae]
MAVVEICIGGLNDDPPSASPSTASQHRLMATEGPEPTAEDKARYNAARDELIKAIAKKRDADKRLAQLEVQLHSLEGAYLVETSAHSGGNIIQGFENYLKNPPGGRRKYEVGDADRLFSMSSMTYKKSLELSGEGEESAATAEDSRMSTPGLTTVIVPPARTQELTAAQQKKNRDREYQRKKRANAARRSAGTPLSDDESVTSNRRPTKRARMADED